jgi:hypothetical protein
MSTVVNLRSSKTTKSLLTNLPDNLVKFLIMPSTQHNYLIFKVLVLTPYMFRPNFAVMFRWYTYFNVNYLNCHAIHSDRDMGPFFISII